MKRRGGLLEVETGFNIIEISLIGKGFEVCNPLRFGVAHPGKRWLDYMRVDITELMTCDFVVSRWDWFLSRGARIEVLLAFLLGIPIYSEKNIRKIPRA
jgi:hypothetical protein